MKLTCSLTYSVFNQRVIMPLVLLIVLLGLSIDAEAKKGKIKLKGEISIGGNDSKKINPNFMLSADRTIVGNLINPVPVNPIHFHLSKDVELKKIKLKDISDADERLYFVIWDDVGNVVVNARSRLDDDDDFDQVHFNNPVPLIKGDYRIAIVGQCLFDDDPIGWRSSCGFDFDFDFDDFDFDFDDFEYDDFEFKSIELEIVDKKNETESIAFIQRRHIGDRDEKNIFGLGYGGRWYPDDKENKEVEYKFELKEDTDFVSVNIYSYRDLTENKNKVQLTLFNKDGDLLDSTYMNLSSASGDFTWNVELDETLRKNREHRLEIATSDKGTIDDISWDDIVIKMERDTPPPANVNHYRISHPGNALTCESTSALILACSENSSSGSCGVATDYSGDVIVQVDGNSETVTLSGGTGLLSGLEKLSPGSVALSFRDNQTYCNQDTADQTSCDISFANIGLQFSQQINNDVDISNQVAGTANNSLYLRALESDGNGTCSVLDTDSNEFKLAYQCISPMDCDENLTFKVGAKSLNDVTETPVTLAKAAAGVYKVRQPVYANAGLIRLSASYVFESNDAGESPETLVTDSNGFAVRPDKFNIKATRYDGSASTDLTERSGNGLMHTHKAEQTFSFAIQAVNANGDITTNYVPDNSKLRIKLTRSIPDADGFEGLFSYAEGLTLSTTPASSSDWTEIPNLPSFDSGVYSFADAMYSEVGAIKINVKDDDYHRMQFSADEDFSDDSKGPEIGRFIPSHFTLVSSKVDNYVGARRQIRAGYDYIFPQHLEDYVAGTTVLQQKDGLVYQCREFPNSGYCVQWNEGSNQYEPGIGRNWDMAWTQLDEPAGGAVFTYMDQPELGFHYYLEAQNVAGLVTKNYLGVNEDVTFIANADGIDYSTRLQDFTGNWCDGVFQPDLCDNNGMINDPDLGMFTRLPSGEDGPIMNTFFGIQVSDPDGVELTDLDLPVGNAPTAKNLDVEASELRYGRWFIFNGSGPTGSEFPVTMQLQYYDGASDTFVTNVDDSITEFTAADATAEINGSAAGLTLTGSGPFSAGATQALMISSTNPGAAILEYINTPPWLQYDWSGNSDYDDMPQAIINFGFFYGNDRVIYRRRLN